MSIEFKLPEVSEGVESADIADIHVSEGDVIGADQIVMELETDKAVVELPCPHAGRIAKVHVSAGDSVDVGATILTIEETDGAPAAKGADDSGDGSATAEAAEGTKPQESEAQATKKAEPEEKATSQEASAKASAAASAGDESSKAADEGGASMPSPPPPEKPSGQIELPDKPPPPAGPATRRLARELGVDLHRVNGSGSGGRITSEDVKEFVKGLTSGAAPATGGGGPVAPPPLPDFSQFGPTERQKLNKIARSSAANLSTSWQVIPHVTQHDLADVTELEAARKRYTQTVGKDGPKVTMTAIMIKAAVAMLKEFPHFNASLDPQTDELVLKKYYHIGCAVDTPNGLLVPVVRDADQKTIVEIAGDLADLAGRARDRKLDLQSMQGANFTITNLGGIGGTAFTPIVNYPEVAILGMSRSRKEVQLTDDGPQERLMMPLSLSYDHRVINGADAARFVSRLCRMLTDYFQFLVEC